VRGKGRPEGGQPLPVSTYSCPPDGGASARPPVRVVEAILSMCRFHPYITAYRMPVAYTETIFQTGDKDIFASDENTPLQSR